MSGRAGVGWLDFAYNAGAGGGQGYFDPTDETPPANYEEALAVLKRYYDYDETHKVITNFPALAYLHNNGDAYRAIGEYVQSSLGAIGIRVSLENQEWATFIHTRVDGDCDVARSGWYMGYADPHLHARRLDDAIRQQRAAARPGRTRGRGGL